MGIDKGPNNADQWYTHADWRLLINGFWLQQYSSIFKVISLSQAIIVPLSPNTLKSTVSPNLITYNGTKNGSPKVVE